VPQACDVDLNVAFGSFGELLDGLDNLTPKPLVVPSFEDEAELLESRIGSAHKAAASTSEGLPNLRKGSERARHNRDKERFVIVR
jgi:hypothetical protein